MSLEKRVRAPNFTVVEKAVLVDIIAQKYKHIIEDKKTDRNTLHQKIEVWKKVEADFNALSPSSYFREWSVLKRFYENRKKEVRKMKALDRASRFKTGGGPEEKNSGTDVSDDILLGIMNPKSVYGLGNMQDSNQITRSTQHTPMTEPADILSICGDNGNADVELEGIVLEVEASINFCLILFMIIFFYIYIC